MSDIGNAESSANMIIDEVYKWSGKSKNGSLEYDLTLMIVDILSGKTIQPSDRKRGLISSCIRCLMPPFGRSASSRHVGSVQDTTGICSFSQVLLLFRQSRTPQIGLFFPVDFCPP